MTHITKIYTMVDLQSDPTDCAGDQDEKTNTKVDPGTKLINTLIESIRSKLHINEKINLVGYIDDPSCDVHQSMDLSDLESTRRTKIIRNAINKYKLNELMEKSGSITIKKSDLLMVHDKDYIDTIFTTARHNKPLGVPGPSINLSMRNIGSLESILAAVASCMGGVDTVCGKFKVSDKNNR